MLLARQNRMADDALSNLLRTVRLTGATFFDIEAQDPWAVRSPAPASILPRILPGADHLISSCRGPRHERTIRPSDSRQVPRNSRFISISAL